MTGDNGPSAASPNDEPTDVVDKSVSEASDQATVEEAAEPGHKGETGHAQGVGSRLRHRVSDTGTAAVTTARSVRERMTGDEGRPKPAALGIAGGLLAVVAAVIVARLSLRPSRRSRRSRRR